MNPPYDQTLVSRATLHPRCYRGQEAGNPAGTLFCVLTPSFGLCFPFWTSQSSPDESKEIIIPLALSLFKTPLKEASAYPQNAFPENPILLGEVTGAQFASITPFMKREELACFVFQHWGNRFLSKLPTINCIKSFQQGFHGYVKGKSYSNCFK